MTVRLNNCGVFNATIDGLPDSYFQDTVPVEVYLTESILTPILSTAVVIQDPIYHNEKDYGFSVKDYDQMKGKNLILSCHHPEYVSGPFDYLNTTQVVYRMENRAPEGRNVEDYILRCCDSTLLTNQMTRISKFYHKKTPTDITADAFNTLGVKSKHLESSTPVRDYDSQNKHPFQVINEQADYALAAANDPSFLHYMTYEDGGKHYFQSLKQMTSAGPIERFQFTEATGDGIWENRQNIIKYEFPCDFDLLTDIMNGYPKQSGSMSINPLTNNPIFDALKTATGMATSVFSSHFTNKGTEDHSATTNYEEAHKYRPARLSLISSDKIALRIVVPFNTVVNAGKMINVSFPSKESPGQLEYGSGDYLIVAITHNIKSGGFGSSTIDCVSKTVGEGIV